MLQCEHFSVSYCGGGLFSTTLPWSHPERTENTYEIIYVTQGSVHMEENGECFTLQKGDLKILLPDIPHKGTLISDPPTAFYWLHFRLLGDPDCALPENRLFRDISSGLFPEILHLENAVGKHAAEPALLHLLTLLRHTTATDSKNRLANRIHEWVRIHASADLTVEKTATQFGYHPEYISRLIKSSFGVPLKNVINMFIISRANDLLDNSFYSVKEIGGILRFRNANAFAHFYKYHEGTTPTKYRNRNFKIHMNAR